MGVQNKTLTRDSKSLVLIAICERKILYERDSKYYSQHILIAVKIFCVSTANYVIRVYDAQPVPVVKRFSPLNLHL